MDSKKQHCSQTVAVHLCWRETTLRVLQHLKQVLLNVLKDKVLQQNESLLMLAQLQQCLLLQLCTHQFLLSSECLQ